mmetsp:Transcript_65600/g.129001  ORF Transcript_65600/g.129001 Transcript_65600/m.129001 type:complete len:311 (+) Transcript_65600:135-1067(+)
MSSLVTQAQTVMHGSSVTHVIPGLLLSVSATLLAYRGVTEEEHHLPLNGFLANILIQMCPLVALKVKIFRCADRVSLVPMVLIKTLIMHAILGVFRIASTFLDGGDWYRYTLAVDTGLFLAALAVLKWQFGLTLTPSLLWEHNDVRNLVGLACAAAFVVEGYLCIMPTSWLSERSQWYAKQGLDLSKVLFTAANYVDIIAFMPVVWRLYQVESESMDYDIGTTVSSDAKTQVQTFFMFVVAFYMWDDVVDPVMSLLDEPIAMMAHAAHFVLLLDFAAFFSFQVQQPSTAAGKEQGEQLQGLLSQMDDDNC